MFCSGPRNYPARFAGSVTVLFASILRQVLTLSFFLDGLLQNFPPLLRISKSIPLPRYLPPSLSLTPSQLRISFRSPSPSSAGCKFSCTSTMVPCLIVLGTTPPRTARPRPFRVQLSPRAEPLELHKTSQFPFHTPVSKSIPQDAETKL